VKRLTNDATEWEDLAATLDELAGELAKSAPYRERRAKQMPTAITLTQWATSLAATGHVDEAIELVPRAAAELRDPSPITIAWLYFQWGRLYEQKGALATAREYYEYAHARMPASLEPIVHLAQTMIATGVDPRTTVNDAVTANPHPDLLALAGRADDARAGWERYVAALPEAFSDHAARFFLGAGKAPARALALANTNFANRDTHEARALVAEAALAAADSKAACAVVEPLTTSLRAHQFVAWKALSACGRGEDAARVARALGIR
jgi:tetratricopeptide (TPR) repeat protein